MKMRYEETEKFKHDFSKLFKKFPSLIDDFRINKQYRIELFHFKGIDSGSIFLIKGVGNTLELKFFKIKKFQCKSLKGRGSKSGIRVIYAYFPIEERIVFIEIYFKTDQENETKKRIIDFKKNTN
ncbi:MAG: hypothetical protein PHH88_01070 [Candidatus Pacebacteria bacterium]|nr:hypothetical protein [Candidatus Paceibacterota bacterium]